MGKPKRDRSGNAQTTPSWMRDSGVVAVSAISLVERIHVALRDGEPVPIPESTTLWWSNWAIDRAGTTDEAETAATELKALWRIGYGKPNVSPIIVGDAKHATLSLLSHDRCLFRIEARVRADYGWSLRCEVAPWARPSEIDLEDEFDLF